MATPSSFGSLMSSRSGIANSVRVSVFINGAGTSTHAGRRVILDRSDTLEENLLRTGRKLGLENHCTAPKMYTKHGILVSDIEEIIEGEVLFFDPRGLPFCSASENSANKSLEEIGLSFGSTSVSVDSNSVVSRGSRRRRSRTSKASANGRSRERSSLGGGGGGGGGSRNAYGSGINNILHGHAATITEIGTPRSNNSPSTVTSVASGPPDIFRTNSFEYDYQFKFIVVGSVAVGKSCLLSRFTDNRFINQHITTKGVDFGTETIRVRGRQRIKIQIWDTAGQEYFVAITKAYFREAAAALLVYDVTNRASFDDLQRWLDNVRNTTTNRSLTIALVGNKSDKVEERQVSEREGQTFARDNGLLFLETSALSGDQVREVFSRTADAVLRKMESGQIDIDDPSQGVRRGDFMVEQNPLPARISYNLGVGTNQRLGMEGDDEGWCACW